MAGKKKKAGSEKARRASNAGRSFQVRVVNSLKAYSERHGGWTYRTTDKITGAGYGLSYKLNTPHDVLFVSDLINLLIECKVSYESDRFNFGAVNIKEEEALLQFSTTGRGALGVVFFCNWQRQKPGDLIIIPAQRLRGGKRHYKWIDDPKSIGAIVVKRNGPIYNFTPKIMRKIIRMKRKTGRIK